MLGTDFILAAAISSLISGIMGLGMSQLNKPKIPKPPPPPNYSSPEGIQRWNPETNTYEWIPTPLTPEQEAQKKTREEKIAALEAGLNQTEPERIAEWDNFERAYRERMLAPLTQQYEQAKRNLEESFAARGLTGSRAHVDALAELERDWQATLTNVQNQAVQAREQLAQQDFQNRLAMLEALRGGKSLEEAQAIRQQGLAQQGTSQAAAINNANWQAAMQGAMARWANTQQGLMGGMQMGGNLALLYGLGQMQQKTPQVNKQPTASLSAYMQPANLASMWSSGTTKLIPYQPAW